MKETNTTKLNITLPADIIQKIKEGNYNRNQLIINLLEKRLKKDKK
jgi:hypothetical protein